MGRKKEFETGLKVRFREDEMKELLEYSEKNDMSVSEIVRRSSELYFWRREKRAKRRKK